MTPEVISRGELAGGPGGFSAAGPRRVGVVIAVCTALAAVLRFYQLSRPGHLLGVSEYDDGVNFGNALRLVSGVLPYRDFVSVHPPGATLLLAPAALAAKVTGTAWGMGIARLLTAAADVACAALLGLLVRHRGAVAAGVASGLYAVYPDALVGARTFMLEPWVNLFCLIGLLLVFERGALASGRRVAYGGVAFGFAVAVKIWAIGPLALLALFMVRRRRRLGAFAGGAAVGLGLPLLPFLLIAPGAFVTDVVIAQFIRSGSRHEAPLPRLLDIAGWYASVPVGMAILLVIAAITLLAAGYLAARRVRTAGETAAADLLDWYAVAGLAVAIAMLLWSAAYFPHYGAFAGPYLALTLALLGSRAWQAVRGTGSDGTGPLLAGLLSVVLLGGLLLSDVAAQARLPRPAEVAATADRLIPPGACVFTNDSSFTISAGRFYSATQGCPVMVDSFGTLLAATDGRGPLAPWPQIDAASAQLRRGFSRARYVWLAPGQIDWTRGLRSYFYQHFRLIGLVTSPRTSDVPAAGLYVAR